MFDVYFIIIGSLAPLVAGLAILWIVGSRRRRVGPAGPSVARRMFKILGWALLLVGIFAVVGLMSHFAFLLAWIATALVLAAAVHRYRHAERQSLLWVLAAAADRGIPLESAARAFADERDDRLGLRSVVLAEFLEAGVPLSLALRRSRHNLPPAALLAADLGQETGTLGPALRQVVQQLDEYDVSLRWAAEKLFYLGFLMLFITGTLFFLMIKIVPVYQYIMDELGMEAPAATQMLVGGMRTMSEGWFLALPLLAVLAVVLILAVLYYVGVSPRSLPGIDRIWRRVDCALILRWLAVAVRQNRSLVEFLRLLASYYPQAGVRRRLERSASRVGKGVHWCDALHRTGLVRAAECAVFKSAERTGNLAWALDEMADSSLRRAAYRLRGIVNVAFPLALLGFACCVLVIATSMFLPLLRLIQGLS
jgi:type IV pilus assembly protein PilC